MATRTVRSSLIDAINEMTQLLENTEDANQQFEVRLKIRELYHRLDRVIITSLVPGSNDFKQALDALTELTKQAKTAKKDLDKIPDTIKSATKAIKKVEKLVKGVSGVLKIL